MPKIEDIKTGIPHSTLSSFDRLAIYSGTEVVAQIAQLISNAQQSVEICLPEWDEALPAGQIIFQALRDLAAKSATKRLIKIRLNRPGFIISNSTSALRSRSIRDLDCHALACARARNDGRGSYA